MFTPGVAHPRRKWGRRVIYIYIRGAKSRSNSNLLSLTTWRPRIKLCILCIFRIFRAMNTSAPTENQTHSNVLVSSHTYTVLYIVYRVSSPTYAHYEYSILPLYFFKLGQIIYIYPEWLIVGICPIFTAAPWSTCTSQRKAETRRVLDR